VTPRRARAAACGNRVVGRGAARGARARRSARRDWAGSQARVPIRAWLFAAGFGAALAAIGLAHLRTTSIGLRYQLAEALRVERGLREQEQQLTVEVQRMRDPLHLQRRARALGMIPPERVIDLRRRAGKRAESTP